MKSRGVEREWCKKKRVKQRCPQGRLSRDVDRVEHADAYTGGG